MKVVHKAKVLAALSLAVSMAYAAKSKASDRRLNLNEVEKTANGNAIVKIDEATRANPYYKSGMRIGLASGRDRGSLLSCKDGALSEPVEFDIEELNQQPYVLGYLQGFIPAYEESRQLVLSQCIKDVQIDSEEEISYASDRMAKIKDSLARSLQAYQQSGCGFDGVNTYCTDTGYHEITKDYFALVWYVAGSDLVTKINHNIGSINKAHIGLSKTSNRKMLEQIKRIAQKSDLNDQDIDRVKELADALKKSDKSTQISPLQNPYEL